MMDVSDMIKRNEHNNHIYTCKNITNNTGMSQARAGVGRCVFLQEIFTSGLENKGEYYKSDQEHVWVTFHSK